MRNGRNILVQNTYILIYAYNKIENKKKRKEFWLNEVNILLKLILDKEIKKKTKKSSNNKFCTG